MPYLWFTLFGLSLRLACSSAVQDRRTADVVAHGVSGGGINYAEVRTRVAHGFAEKANEIADAIAVLHEISKATADLTDKISKRCSE